MAEIARVVGPQAKFDFSPSYVTSGLIASSWLRDRPLLEDETMMKARLDYFAAAPAAMKAMLDLEKAARSSGLEQSLIELVKIRASQINGCAYCIHMHTKDARASGETEERIYLLDAWRESPLYSDRERAALAWTEALTLISQTHAPDGDYAALKAHFSDEDQVKLTLLIVTINAWNRFAIGFRAVHPVEQGRAAA